MMTKKGNKRNKRNKMVTLKELTSKPERLSPGHRTCTGCGIPQIVRTVLSATDKPVVVANATGCLEVTTTVYPYTSWKVPWIHSAFENAAATIAGVESAYNALKRKGKIKKDKEIKFVAFGGDGGTYDIGLQALSGAMERGHDFVYVCYDNEAYMNCLSLDTFVMTEKGLKKITDIKLGEKVYAFDQKTYELVLKRCTGIFDNGVKKVYEVNTFHHTIKATSNHPFLVLKRKGRGKKSHLRWKTLAELKKNDEIVVLKKSNPGKSFNFKPIKLSKKGDYKVNKINNIKIPKRSSPELMELLGLYVGDGWTRTHKAEIGFALPKNTKGRNRLIKLHKKLFKKDLTGPHDNYIYIYSINLARFIDSLGFGKGAKEKLIPDWVFTLSDPEKEAFIQGLMLSDGYKIDKSCRYVSASYNLLKTLRLLLQTTNYRVGKIHLQTKKKGTYVVYRQLLEDSTYGYICFSRKKGYNISKYPSQARQGDFLADNKHFSTEKIISIEFIKKEPTLDLRVEGEHNFVADGIVVHNTGVQRSSATPYGANTTTSPDGKVKHGKEQFKKNFTEICVAHGIPYVAQSAVHAWADLYNKAEKAFKIKGPAVLVVLQPCTLGWKFRSDMTIELSKLAAETNFWPLYEVECGKYTLNHQPKERLPLTEFIKHQKRFKHLLKPENKHILEKLQKHIDDQFKNLVEKAQAKLVDHSCKIDTA
jgi:pyruvate/2-oxoacid:ferredoxin oxidoreductase beta subunit